MNWLDPAKTVDIPDGFIPGMGRGDNQQNNVTHLYRGTFSEPQEPMCDKGWNRDNGAET